MPRSSRPVTVHGWLNLHKPLNITSTQALGRARRLVGGQKVGHGGTLDPLASGVLPLAFGEATKLLPWVVDGKKSYEFTLRWGESRTTDDAEGEVIECSDVRPDIRAIEKAIPAFTGNIQQIPPVFSAIKINGERAYDLARSGKTIELLPREVAIHSLELVDILSDDTASFRVTCGRGMYVRSLVRDLARHLGTVAYLAVLCRTRVGAFTLDNAVTIEQLEALAEKDTSARAALLPMVEAFSDVPQMHLTPREAHDVRAGRRIVMRPDVAHLTTAPFIVASCNSVPHALMAPENGEFKVLRGFRFR